MASTSSLKSSVSVCAARRVTAAASAGRNPGPITRILYRPFVRYGRTYTPASVVVAFESTLVSTLVATTVAPTSTPPPESVTVPLNWDRAPCACATPAHTRYAADDERLTDSDCHRLPPHPSIPTCCVPGGESDVNSKVKIHTTSDLSRERGSSLSLTDDMDSVRCQPFESGWIAFAAYPTRPTELEDVLARPSEADVEFARRLVVRELIAAAAASGRPSYRSGPSGDRSSLEDSRCRASPRPDSPTRPSRLDWNADQSGLDLLEPAQIAASHTPE